MTDRRPAVHVTANRERVALGARVKARTRGTVDAVVAIDVPRDVLARISVYAGPRGLTVSQAMLEAAERMIATEQEGD